MITIDELRRVPLFAALPDGEAAMLATRLAVPHGSVTRVASAVGEGSMAIAFIHQFLGSQQLLHSDAK